MLTRETCTLNVSKGGHRVNEEQITLILNMLILRAHTGAPCLFREIRAYLLEHSFETSAHHTDAQLHHLIEIHQVTGSRLDGYKITLDHLTKLIKANKVTGSKETGFQLT